LLPDGIHLAVHSLQVVDLDSSSTGNQIEKLNQREKALEFDVKCTKNPMRDRRP